jgi:NAD(P)-dependent dehydrogenase (short-subunit alcohol dehydrogenase family)
MSHFVDLMMPEYAKVIVTGGGSGIGRVVTQALTELGVDVVVMGRRMEKLEETRELCAANSGKVIPVRCDITDLAQVEAAFAQANKDGVVQALVNSAGEVGPCRADQLTSDMFSTAINSMLVGGFNVCRTWTRSLLKAGKGGSFIAYTSTVNSRETPGLSHSGMAKAGVESMMRSWALELGHKGLRYNAIGPGLFPLTGGTHHDDAFNREFFSKQIPLGRFGEADEIIGPTLFLLSPAARYITGSTMMVDGGMRLRPWFGFTPEDLAGIGEPV